MTGFIKFSPWKACYSSAAFLTTMVGAGAMGFSHAKGISGLEKETLVVLGAGAVTASIANETDARGVSDKEVNYLVNTPVSHALVGGLTYSLGYGLGKLSEL